MVSTRSETRSELIHHQVSWALAALDLYLDMERNLSDNQYADHAGNEIIYTFDEDIFELFVGGHDQPNTSKGSGRIYTDRRRAVGVFHTRAWRSLHERHRLSATEEAHRAQINRQSAMLTTEWLFGGHLPGRKSSAVYITRPHFRELSSRWEILMATLRPQIAAATELERRHISELEDDQATAAASTNPPDGRTVTEYIRNAPQPLRTDLDELWREINATAHSRRAGHRDARSFWQFAFSRKLASTLTSLRVTEPISQLLRINNDIANRLKFVHQVMTPDDPDAIPPSETSGFWKERLLGEIEARKKRNPNISRDHQAIENDAHAIALVQALANTAARARQGRRFVFVTADPLLIDAYRAWHCTQADNYEPFILRPVRHFAPLLNITSMSRNGETDIRQSRAKEDIFPLLRAAIEPFLLKLNLGDSVQRRPGHEDSVRWYREQYALKLRRALIAYDADPQSRDRDEKLRSEVADQMIFPSALGDLAEVNDKLVEIVDKGRRVERFAIGFGFEWLNKRLAARKELQEAQRELSKGDETPLANYMQRVLAELRSANLDLRVKFVSISSDLQIAVNRIHRGSPPWRKVPLAFNLTLKARGSNELISVESDRMVTTALENKKKQRRAEISNSLDLDLPNIRETGGYRFFALYCCIALRLNEWGVADHCATEAYTRVENEKPFDPDELVELEYLYCFCIRFRIGSGPIQDASNADVTFERYGEARQLLQLRSDFARIFVDFRAAAELTSLIIFGCAWSMAEYPISPVASRSFPKELVESEFAECITLLLRLLKVLRSHSEGGDTMLAQGDAAQIQQFKEQIAVNICASYCLTKLGLRSGDAAPFHDCLNILREDPDALAWIDNFASQSRVGDPRLSEVGQLYLEWFEYLRGTTSKKPENRVRNMSLRIDQIVAARFERDLERRAEGTIR